MYTAPTPPVYVPPSRPVPPPEGPNTACSSHIPHFHRSYIVESTSPIIVPATPMQPPGSGENAREQRVSGGETGTTMCQPHFEDEKSSEQGDNVPGTNTPPRRQQQQSKPKAAGGPTQVAPKPSTTTRASAMTTANINKAFGTQRQDDDNNNRRVRGSTAGGKPIVMPTLKEGNDAMSMYSMSQSILPTDPRDRLYYRPKRHLLQCYVVRKKEGGLLRALVPGRRRTYQFFLEHTNEFVIAARSAVSGDTVAVDNSDGTTNGDSSYSVKRGLASTVFSINQKRIDKDASSFVGKISRRNFGMHIIMFSEGSVEARKEIAAVLIEPMADGQRRFKVILPAIDEATGVIAPLEGGTIKYLRDGRAGTSVANGSRAGSDSALHAQSNHNDSSAATPTQSASTTTTSGGAISNHNRNPNTFIEGGGEAEGKKDNKSVLVHEYRENPLSKRIIVLQNKTAEWDSVLRGYRLDFHGRVTKASEKNFQLVASSNPSKVVMLFGKKDTDKYAVDFRYPLCGLQAAAVAAAMMDVRIVSL